MTPCACACATEDNQPFSYFLPPSRGDSSDTPSLLREDSSNISSSLRGRIKVGVKHFLSL